MAEVYDVVLQLSDVEHLFTKPDVSPLSDEYQEYSYISGLEFIADLVYGDLHLVDRATAPRS